MTSFGGWEYLIIIAIFVGLFIAALASIGAHRTASGLEKAIWVLIALLFPVIGPFLWFAIGKRSAHGASA
jgi:Phospholipase_D-nuclease N-terminal